LAQSLHVNLFLPSLNETHSGAFFKKNEVEGWIDGGGEEGSRHTQCRPDGLELEGTYWADLWGDGLVIGLNGPYSWTS
jgi:hypothetical protein